MTQTSQIVTSKRNQVLSTEEFFVGIFAKLKLRGIQSFNMNRDRHNHQFKKMMDHFHDVKKCFPKIQTPLLIPMPDSGFYKEFDNAIHHLEYTGLTWIDQSPGKLLIVKLDYMERAQKIFDSFSPQLREFFTRLTEHFPKE